MQGHMSMAMQGMSGQAPDTQKGLQHAMMQMNGPMMEGMMAGDPDVAWICAMIPHHMGAIAMAQVGLRVRPRSQVDRARRLTRIMTAAA